MEIWKDIKGFEGHYQISSLGRVKSLKYKKERIMKLRLSKYKGDSAYYEIWIIKNNVSCAKRIHRLVAETFIDNPNNLPVVNHKDGDKLNNNVDNLEWCTYSHNNKHSYVLGKNKTKEVNQIDLKTGQVIKKWDSMKKASLELGVNSSNIRKCIQGKNKSCGGFKWTEN